MLVKERSFGIVKGIGNITNAADKVDDLEEKLDIYMEYLKNASH